MGLFGRDHNPDHAAPQTSHRLAAPTPGTTTVVATGTTINGEIAGSSDLRIEGSLTGSIDISGVVYVAETGNVATTIRAATITVAGRVEGDIVGDQGIELEPTASVRGNLLAPKIHIREGASLQGRVEMASPAAPTDDLSRKKSGKKGGGKKNGAVESDQPPAETTNETPAE